MNLRRSAAVQRSGTSLIEGLEARALFAATTAVNPLAGTMLDAGPIAVAKNWKVGRGGSDGAAGFQITLNFGGGLTSSQQAIFSQAAALWESILTVDIPDAFTSSGLVDDIRIDASGVPIDGVNNILGQAGPTSIRNDSLLPITGQMQFDTADLANLENNGLLDEVITHEMGHVLGIGSLWSYLGLVSGAGGADPRYIGAAAVAQYRALAGNASLTSVPVENTGGSGTAGAHWRENGGSSLGNELMTGYINSNLGNPLSRISAAALVDMGYPGVNIDAGQTYTVPVNPSSNFAAVNPLPTVGTLNATTPVANTSNFAIVLSSASDNSSVASVSFYRESNGIPGLQTSPSTTAADTLIVTNSGGANLTASVAAGLAVGSYTFYARATDNFGAVSAVASKVVSITAPIGPTTPSTPALSAAQDTGDSNSDGITKLNVLTFTGTTTPNATVTLFRNGSTNIGSGTADAAGNYSITTGTLADGSFNVTAVASNAGGTSSASTPRAITVDTIAPAVVSSTYDREVTQAITLVLDGALANRLTTSSVTLQNLTTSTTVANTTIAVSGGGTTATFDRASLLADGNYRLTLPAAGLTDVAGNALSAPLVFEFRQLGGDADNNGSVDFSDLLVLAQNYNTGGKTFSGANFDYSSDGVVDFSDLLILAQNYGSPAASLLSAVLVPASTATPAPTKKAVPSRKPGSAVGVVS